MAHRFASRSVKARFSPIGMQHAEYSQHPVSASVVDVKSESPSLHQNHRRFTCAPRSRSAKAGSKMATTFWTGRYASEYLIGPAADPCVSDLTKRSQPVGDGEAVVGRSRPTFKPEVEGWNPSADTAMAWIGKPERVNAA